MAGTPPPSWRTACAASRLTSLQNPASSATMKPTTSCAAPTARDTGPSLGAFDLNGGGHPARLGTLPLGRLSAYLQAGSYPENVRGTLRDTVTAYLAHGLLGSAINATTVMTDEQIDDFVGFPVGQSQAVRAARDADAGKTEQPVLQTGRLVR